MVEHYVNKSHEIELLWLLMNRYLTLNFEDQERSSLKCLRYVASRELLDSPGLSNGQSLSLRLRSKTGSALQWIWSP